MKNRFAFLVIAFMAHYMAVGYSAEEQAAAGQQASIPETTLQALRAKMGQARAVISEIQDLLIQETKILNRILDQKEQAKKNKASLAEYNRYANILRQEIQQTHDQVEEAKKELAAYTRQEARFSRLQVEFEKVKSERLDSESEARQAEAKLAAVQKNLSELNNRFVELAKQANEAKKQSQNLENTKALLETERTKRAEAHARAEKAVATAEKAEKERLILASRLAELEQNLPPQQEQQKESSEQANIQGEIEKERKAIRETEGKIKKDEKAREEAKNKILELKQKLRESEKNTRRGAEKDGDLSRLQSRLADVKKQRAEAEERLKESEGNLRESENAIAGLTNMIAAARIQEENNKENAKAFVPLMGELERETALMNEVTARVDKQIRNLKALEDEKRRLNESLILVKERLDKEGQKTNKLDEIRFQLAGQKKIRTDMETKLEQTTRNQDALKEEIKQLNQALIEAGNIILNNEKDVKAAEQVADELRKENELARKSADLLREKEQNVKRLGEDKKALQIKLNETEAKLAQQKEYIKTLDENRRAINEEKKARIASDKKYTELAQAEKKHKAQIKELESKASAADKESKRLSLQADKISAEIGAGQTAAVGGSETKETQNAQTAAASSRKDTMTVEQDILNQARAGASQPSGQQPEKKTSKQTKSRSRQNKIAEAEEHYALAIQKWDEDDLDGAIEEFKKTVSLNPDAAGAYYNLSLAFMRQGKKEEACDYAYQAGECYIRINNLIQASRMTVLMTKIDQNSRLIQKLRNKIAAATK
ncbi:MAG: tetratricopeptide repeat protein [Kiritimatiellia bacterium]|nr:tetratricopeptide repeat protein [Kiritimatiellia bacterium]